VGVKEKRAGRSSLSTFHVHPFPQIIEFLCGHTRAYMVMLSACSDLPKNKNQIMPLHNLPYDLLLNISQYLDLHDIYALQLVSLVFVLHVEQSLRFHEKCWV
jgi:hypothetical protein